MRPVTQHIILLVIFIWYLCYCIESLDLLIFGFSYQFSDFHLCYWSFPVHVCLNHITWSCTRVTAWACHLALSYVLTGYFLTTLNPHIQILESELWWPCCSWSECAAEAWISGCFSFFQPPLDRLARFSSYYLWVLSYLLYCTSFFYASWWSNILGILYHTLW